MSKQHSIPGKHGGRFLFTASLAGVLLSCGAAPAAAPGGAKNGGPVPLLSTGWYQYDFERTFKSIENEYAVAQSTGMKMVQEVTYKYTGVVCRFEEGVLYDPVTAVELAVDGEGVITCAENPSIKGKVDQGGRFFWGGLTEEQGGLTGIFVKGTLSPLPPGARGGREYDGVYHVTDSGTGREQLVNISSGFYTWRYLDDEEAGFNPWPTLVRPGGVFGFSLEMTTVLKMGEFSQADYSTSFVVEGKIVPGQGISLEEYSRTAGVEAPRVYAGAMIRAGEYPNEAVPRDIESLVRSGRAVVKAAPKPDRSRYPPWYLKLPAKAGFIYALGEKSFGVKETALAMAEAAAAANIAEQLRVRIEARETESSTAGGTRLDSRIDTSALENLNYRTAEQVYDEGSHTAFVLVEMPVD